MMITWTVRRVAETGSTNSDLAELARAGAPEGTVLVADHQRAGRGRLDRSWHTPAGVALTASFLLRPTDVPAVRWPWIPLLTGVAVVDAVRSLARSAGVRPAVVDVGLKWPNDVLAGDHKLAGILAEQVETPGGGAVVVGVGLNVAQEAATLPAGAVSLASLGVPVRRDDVLDAVAEALGSAYVTWRKAAGEPAAGLAEDYQTRCVTLGRPVRALLPGGAEIVGTASAIDEFGRIVVVETGESHPISAADVVHLRPA